eukprot:4220726-Pyramimonas_sp.AAC.1
MYDIEIVDEDVGRRGLVTAAVTFTSAFTVQAVTPSAGSLVGGTELSVRAATTLGLAGFVEGDPAAHRVSLGGRFDCQVGQRSPPRRNGNVLKWVVPICCRFVC